MKKIILILAMLLFLSTSVFAATVSRVVSSNNVATSSSFTVKYTVSGGVAPYYYIIRDTISSGGCTFAGTVDPKVLPTTFNSPATETVSFTVNTPSSSGKCTMSGFSKLGDAANVNLEDAIINVGSATACDTTTCGTWSDSTNSCGTRTCTDTNCAGTDVSKSCPSTSGGGKSNMSIYLIIAVVVGVAIYIFNKK